MCIRDRLRTDAFGAGGDEALAAVLADCPDGAVVLWPAGRREEVSALLASAGLNPDQVAVAQAVHLDDVRAVARFAARAQALTVG